MSRIRVLIADDEIPYGVADEDRKTKERLLRRIEGATEADYCKGRDGMARACKVLRAVGMDVTEARTLNEARNAIAGSKQFDVAILDLGWLGDPECNSTELSGWELVELMEKSDRARQTPIIMYSNKFDREESLARTAADLKTLPLAKTYTDGSHQTLVCAVRYLTQRTQSTGDTLFSTALDAFRRREEDFRRSATLCRWLIGVVAVVLVSAAAALLLNHATEAIVVAIASVLVGTLLVFASKHAGEAAERARTAFELASKHASLGSVENAA